MEHLTSFKLPCNQQPQSFFFEVLPGEIRDRIYIFSLSRLDDKTHVWDKNSSWVRPGYDAPQKADTALLQACQRVYTEAWFRPWLSTTHSFWLASEGRRPNDKQRHTETTFQPALSQLFEMHGMIELDHVRVFAQLWALEPGSYLSKILQMTHFYPKVITVTIRHHDWWWWENDHHLKLDAVWVNHCRFPSSVTQLRLELESLQRRKNQIDYIANEVTQKWQFLRQDDVVMTADEEDWETSTWSGSSTWEGVRWIRDETRPETNEYYIKTVVFRPNKEIATRILTQRQVYCPGHMFPQLTGPIKYLSVEQLLEARVKPGTPAEEAKKMVDRRYGTANDNVDPGGQSDDDDDDFDEPTDQANSFREDDEGDAGEYSIIEYAKDHDDEDYVSTALLFTIYD